PVPGRVVVDELEEHEWAWILARQLDPTAQEAGTREAGHRVDVEPEFACLWGERVRQILLLDPNLSLDRRVRPQVDPVPLGDRMKVFGEAGPAPMWDYVSASVTDRLPRDATVVAECQRRFLDQPKRVLVLRKAEHGLRPVGNAPTRGCTPRGLAQPPRDL